MKQNYPKFNEKINEMMSLAEMQKQKTRYAILVSYDRGTNTAKLLVEDRNSGELSDIITNVPCPYVNGIQTVAPEPGARCVVGFRDVNETIPFVVSFYVSPNDSGYYHNNNRASSHIPRYMV